MIPVAAVALLKAYAHDPVATLYVLAGLVGWGIVATARAALGAWQSARELNAYDAELRQVCPKCGYDMRATPQRCPECGRATEMIDASPPPGFFESQPRLRQRRDRR